MDSELVVVGPGKEFRNMKELERCGVGVTLRRCGENRLSQWNMGAPHSKLLPKPPVQARDLLSSAGRWHDWLLQPPG